MEKNNIALSEMERNKELFEYEMTEVILQLKGKFAKISGKDLQLDESQFETPSMEIRSDIPNVDIQPISIASIGAETTFSGDFFTIPEIVIESSKIDCPAVPVPVVSMPFQVKVKQPVLDCKTVDKVKAYAVTEAKINLPIVSAVVPSISIKKIPEITFSEIEIQSFDATIKLPRTRTNASIEVIKVDVLDTTINVSNIEIDVSTSPITVETDIPMVYGNYSPVSIEVKLNNVSDVSVPKVAEFTVHEVFLTDENIEIPMIPKVKKYNGESIIISNHETKPLDFPEIKTAIFYPTTVEATPLEVDAVRVPDMSSLPDKGVIVKVEKPTIDFEYPTAKVVKIPNVSLKATENLDIPVMPDFESEIQDIIDSAV